MWAISKLHTISRKEDMQPNKNIYIFFCLFVFVFLKFIIICPVDYVCLGEDKESRDDIWKCLVTFYYG